MEQYLLQLPKRLAQEVRSGIANGDSANVDMVAEVQLPTILETHKTYDDNFFTRAAKLDRRKKILESQDEVPNGLTPPNTNVVKRKYDKTKKTTPFPVQSGCFTGEEDLVKIIAGGAIEDVHEELVDYYDWMTDEEHPGGIIVTDEMELIREHPEYLTLSEEPLTRNRKYYHQALRIAQCLVRQHFDHEYATCHRCRLRGRVSNRRPGFCSAIACFAPTPSPRLSPMQLHSQASPLREKAYLTDPTYLKLLPIRDRLQKSVRDADRDISELSAKVDANSNIIVKNRFKQMLETARVQRAEITTELDRVNAEIFAFESS
ncbi:putative TAFII55 protein region [Plasmopara halstedii]